MIKRLTPNMLIEFSIYAEKRISWRLIITDKGTREVNLTAKMIQLISKWESEFAALQNLKKTNFQ